MTSSAAISKQRTRNRLVRVDRFFCKEKIARLNKLADPVGCFGRMMCERPEIRAMCTDTKREKGRKKKGKQKKRKKKEEHTTSN